jgi:hypothetical protein
MLLEFLDGMICSKIDLGLIAVSIAILDVLPFRAVVCGTDLAWWWLKIMGDCLYVFGGGGDGEGKNK